MSGYRSIHRQTLGNFPIWSIASSPLLTTGSTAHQKLSAWRIWVACGDGVVRGYLVTEKSVDSDVLDASACSVQLTHLLLGASQQKPSEDDDVSTQCIGCSQVQVARNYTGDDDDAGDLILISMDLVGNIRIWILPEDMDNDLTSDTTADEPALPEIAQEFRVENATGTCVQIMPPSVSGVGNVLLAVPCLDGTIALVATGVSTPKSTKDPTQAGEVIERWSKATSSIALCGDFSCKQKSFVVGRQDGLVETFGDKHHRLIQHEAPVRSVAVTPDGNLIVSASDDGMVCLWDNSRPTPVLVQHVVQAHATWVLSQAALSDSRRVVSCGADSKLNVWGFSQMDNQALHTFTSDETVWAMDALTTKSNTSTTQTSTSRLVTGSEKGGLHIYTLES
mmetsp:Transcript_9301/g.23120  ORF Transcript_9301/g.23120 Transcript_9301/m.23120 type:complete len:393 (-) Transcript_9301:67-1245(-)